MPPTIQKGSTALDIVLHRDADHVPGGKMAGSVIRKKPLPGSQAKVTVSLHGRAKVKFGKMTSKYNVDYRSRFQLIDDLEHTHVLQNPAADAPIDINDPAGVSIWAFAIEIPTYVSPVASEDHDKDWSSCSFLPLDEDSISEHVLPMTAKSLGPGMWAFVEYWLRADLECFNELGHQIGFFTAVHPFKMRKLPPEPSPGLKPSFDFAMRPVREQGIARSQTLNPITKEEDLGVRDKMKRAFGASGLPTFGFIVETDLPSRMELGSSTAVPLLLKVVPDWESTSEALRGITPAMSLKSARLTVITTNTVLADPIKGQINAYENDETVDVLIRHYGPGHQDPIEIKCSTSASPVHIGKFAVGSSDGVNMGGLVARFLVSDYTTYNIKTRHQLEWTFVFMIAGSTVPVKGRMPLEIEQVRRGVANDSGPKKWFAY